MLQAKAPIPRSSRHFVVILSVCAWLSVPLWSQPFHDNPSPGPPTVIWEEPQRFTEDLSDPASRPQPPFRFVEEDLGGTNPKLKVKDAKDRLWIVKWSEEIHAETFASRLVVALGYFARPTFFLLHGKIEGVEDLGRAESHVEEEDGSFRNACFKLISEEPYMAGVNWAWINNPFLETQPGRQQLNGLKILMMLTSNWDAKDARDVARGSNTAIYRTTGKGQMVRFLYAMDDWGASMGRWGNAFTREKWDCEAYSKQTPNFVKGVEDGFVKWGYTGTNAKDVTDGISVDDVRWLLKYLGKITDRQFEAALRSSGAEEDEVSCFGRAIRERIRQLQSLSASQRAR